MEFKLSALPVLILISLTLMLAALSTHASAASYQISGYISPDFNFNESQAAVLKSGFTAEIVGTSYKAQTNNEGYFIV